MVCFVGGVVHRACSKAAVLKLGFLKRIEIANLMGFLGRDIKNIQRKVENS